MFVSKPKLLLICYLLILFAIFQGGCERESSLSKSRQINPNIAQVNNEFITAKDLELNFSIIWKSDNKIGRKDLNARIFIDQLIRRKLILQASKSMNVKVEDSEVYSYFESLFFPLDKKSLQKKISEKKGEIDEWIKTIREIIKVNKVIREKIYSKFQVKEDEKQVFYKNNLSRYSSSRRLRVRQIVVEKKQMALKSHSQLVRGSVFPVLAKQKSIGPNSFLGGDLGYLELKNLPSSLRQALENLSVEEISKVVSSPSGYHIFQITEIRSAYIKPFRSVENMIREELILKKGRESLKKWIKVLRKNAKIIYFE
ncbi:MAG: peptidyl-prolyl cis-trans isomerase [Nitrospinota bacterium]|nr:peptidyl-prolyl cis-trans isomerase [Nitrospinota bacterium]